MGYPNIKITHEMIEDASVDVTALVTDELIKEALKQAQAAFEEAILEPMFVDGQLFSVSFKPN